MTFQSDNTPYIHDLVLEALLKINKGHSPSYGADNHTTHVQKLFCDVFEKEVTVFFVATGTAANALSLASLTARYGAIFCHKDAHINTDEANAPEFFTGGAKIIPLEGKSNKIDPTLLNDLIIHHKKLAPHTALPKTLSLTQGTEAGTVYTPSELFHLCSLAKKHQLSVHMDGARFANAVVSYGASPADLSWKSGIDVLCLGGTKNGCMAAEAVVFFNKSLALHFDYLQKQSGHLMSKMRFFSQQFQAYFTDDLWLKNAFHANQMATYIGEILLRCTDVSLLYPIETNELFVQMPSDLARYLRHHGMGFYDWGNASLPHYRFVASFATTHEDVHNLKELIQKYSHTSEKN